MANLEEMKKQTIGVEIEMNNISRKKAAEVVAKYFGTKAKYTANINGYETWSTWDREKREWKFMKDSSIVGPDEEKCEMVTPILEYKDIEELQNIVRLLRKHGAKSDSSRGCGVHIHIGANGHTAKSLRILANMMASHEKLLIKALKLDECRINCFCRTVNFKFLTNVNKVKPKTMSLLADVWYSTHNNSINRNSRYNNSRYQMLNLHATFTKGTIEFRLFEFEKPNQDRKNGLHAGQLKAYIQLCLALSQQAKEMKRATSREQQKENPKYAMRTWLLRLGFIGDEFKTAREIFTKRLEGNAAFR